MKISATTCTQLLTSAVLSWACLAPELPPVELLVEELVTNPTAHGVQIAVVPAVPVEAYVEYGRAPDFESERTALVHAGAGELVAFQLESLEPGVRYAYRLRVRAPGSAVFGAREPHSFRTLRTAGDFTFAYAADSHITERWLASRCTENPRARLEVATFERTLEHLEDPELDFVIASGDNFMTHSPQLVSCDEWSGAGTGTVRTTAEAALRYQIALSPELWGRVTPDLPFLYVLGNHDGEAHFGDARGSYGHFPDTRELSRAARLQHLPDPTAVYSGSANGDLYYTFTSGAARFVILDVMAGPRDYPAHPEDWTLGAEQLSWFEHVLSANEHTFVFVFMEHLLGGRPGVHERLAARTEEPLPDYAYGRGSMLSTVDGTARGDFIGEQARLQELMSAHGVQLAFHGHDHIAVAGEKLGADGAGEGVIYVMGGQASGVRSRWEGSERFQESTDYDGDGVPDFMSDVNGSRSRGFYRVQVFGGERVVVSYVRSDAADAEADGAVAFSFELRADGSNTLPLPGSAAGR